MINRLLRRALKNDKKSALLLGPRQVGKSTLLHSLGPDLVIDLSSQNEYFLHSSDPNYLSSLLPNKKLVLIDEIQRIPGLLNTVQYEIDKASREKRHCRFLLSGSSARKLRRGQSNLLPGRIFQYQLSGFCARELDFEINFDKALRFGFLPEPYLDDDEVSSQKLLVSYASAYLTEEIQAEALTRNIEGFARFLKVMAEKAGQILDYSKLSTKSKVSRTSLVRFVELLEDTLIARVIDSFNESDEAQVVRHPKLYFFDVGVLNGLNQNFTASPDRVGILSEHLVLNQMVNSSLAQGRNLEFSFFRTRHGAEVDFVVKEGSELWAIEVKTGKVDESDLNGLKIFKHYYPRVKNLYAVSTSEKRRSIKGVTICSVIDLLKDMNL
jgi:predicted AAA+ superfamily ATPase